MAATPIPTPPVQLYRWSFRGAPLRIELSLSLVAKLSAELGSSGSHFGLLRGRTRPGITEIATYEPLASADAAAVDRAMAAAANPVGFYRVVPRGNLFLPEPDRRMAETQFRHPTQVILLIEEPEHGYADAKFCFWGEGELHDLPIMIFPFDAALLKNEERPEIAEAQPEPAPEPIPVAAAPGFAVAPPARHRPVMAIAGVGVILAGALALTGTLMRHSDTPADAAAKTPVQPVATPSAPASVMDLSARRTGRNLEIRWNTAAPSVASADFGMLRLWQSGEKGEVPLSASQLRTGQATAQVDTGEAQLELTVVSGQNVARETLTVPIQPVLRVPAAPPVGRIPIDVPVAVAPAPKPFTAPGSASPARASSLPTHIDEAPPLVASAQPSARVPLPGAIPQAPAPIPAIQTPASASPQLRPQVTAPAKPVQQPPAQPRTSAPAAAPSSNEPVNRQLKPEFRQSPAIPAQLRASLVWPVVVEVWVTVNREGEVIKAEAVQKKGVHPFLRDAATQAALQWKFEPAMVNGKPVTAQTMLQFRFGPQR